MANSFPETQRPLSLFAVSSLVLGTAALCTPMALLIHLLGLPPQGDLIVTSDLANLALANLGAALLALFLGSKAKQHTRPEHASRGALMALVGRISGLVAICLMLTIVVIQFTLPPVSGIRQDEATDVLQKFSVQAGRAACTLLFVECLFDNETFTCADALARMRPIPGVTVTMTPRGPNRCLIEARAEGGSSATHLLWSM